MNLKFTILSNFRLEIIGMVRCFHNFVYLKTSILGNVSVFNIPRSLSPKKSQVIIPIIQ